MKRFFGFLRTAPTRGLAAALIVFVLALSAWGASQGGPRTAPKADGGAMKVGFVDLDRVVKESRYISGQVAAINSQAQQLQEKLDQSTGKYARLAQQLDEQRTVLAKEQLDARMEELKQLRSDSQELDFRIKKLLSDSRSEILSPALEKAVNLVETIGRAEGYDLIVNGESVLFASKSIDLTQRVIDELDKSTPAQTGKAAPVSSTGSTKSTESTAPAESGEAGEAASGKAVPAKSGKAAPAKKTPEEAPGAKNPAVE